MGFDGVAIFVNGTVGVGKTTTIDAMGDLLTVRGVPHAVIDLDRVRQAWPPPEGDPFNHELELVNLASLAANYAAAGITTLVLAGVIEGMAAVARYEHAVAGLRLVIVRLTADEQVRKARLKARHIDDPDGLEWHLHRTVELEDILDSRGLDHMLVDTSSRSPSRVAEDIIEAVSAFRST
jgi:adenylylsulfate kinase